MKMKLFFIPVIALALVCEVSAQADQTILNISGDNITRSEFEKVFRKNNSKEASFTKKDVNDYLELFINYKLKVREALEMKMDTVSAFQSELAGYRKQLAQPYLADKSVTDSLLHEAYNRLKTEVRASHILVKCAPDALPKDTIEAYNKALKIRADVMKGADFTKLAKEISGDPSAKENGGDLGYFTALQMVYQFENAVYSTPVGQVSMPVRTRFGYHIIKVTDQRPAQGEIKVAQIHVKFQTGGSLEDSTKALAKINEIYGKLKAGESFENLARQFSDDQTTAKNGGALPMFGTGRMVPEFEKAAFELKNIGDYSKPVQTSIGWHLIKLLERKPLGTYEELQGDIKAKVSKDSRSEISKSSMVNRIKKKYGFKETPKAKDEFAKVADSTLVQGKWTADKADKLNGVMFTLGTQSYTYKDFASYVADHQTRKTSVSPKQFASDLYNEWVNQSVIAYEEARLDENYPEFKALMQEYRDGILLFRTHRSESLVQGSEGHDRIE
jgi:peptidyl-prolyl cis-trans isomerase SurA